MRHDSADSIHADLVDRATQAGDPRLAITFPVQLPENVTPHEVEQWLSASGFTRVQAERVVEHKKVLDVVADRLRIVGAERVRVVEAIELALKRGGGRVNVYVLRDDAAAELWRYSTGLHCPESDIRYPDPQPALFSFNSAYGACDTCRGFGRVIGVDWGLVIPDHRKTLRSGAIKPLQTPAWKECQDDLLNHAGNEGIPRDTAWSQLTEAQRHWVIEGSPLWKGKWNQQWYGVRRFFGYLESKAYKMHIRVLLSKYRSYTPCTVCNGARLKLDALLWRVGSQGRRRCGARSAAALHAGRRVVDGAAVAGDAGPHAARPDAAADRAAAALLRFAGAGLEHARRGAEAAAGRDPHAAEVPVRRRPRLPHARPTEPHAERAARCSAST